MLHPDDYFPISKSKLIIRLTLIVTSLAELYEQHHTAVSEERRARYDILLRSSETTESGRKREADQGTIYLRDAIEELDTQILIYKEERDLIKYILGMSDAERA